MKKKISIKKDITKEKLMLGDEKVNKSVLVIQYDLCLTFLKIEDYVISANGKIKSFQT